MEADLFYFFALPTAFIFTIIALAAIFERFEKTPWSQAEKRRKANERFKEIIGG
jgi:hypothetical protein